MKKSIRRQFALIFIGLMAGIILMCWVINNIFLEDYYIRSKTQVLYDTFHTISGVTGSDTYSSDEFREELETLLKRYG